MYYVKQTFLIRSRESGDLASLSTRDPLPLIRNAGIKHFNLKSTIIVNGGVTDKIKCA